MEWDEDIWLELFLGPIDLTTCKYCCDWEKVFELLLAYNYGKA